MDPQKQSGIEKLETHIPGFDLISNGGLSKGRTTLVSGTAGSAKTVFAVQFLAEGILKSHEPGVFITFEESPEDIRKNMVGFSWDHCCPRQGLRMTIEALPEVLHVAECQTKQSNASINGGLRCYGTASESVQSIASAGSPR